MKKLMTIENAFNVIDAYLNAVEGEAEIILTVTYLDEYKESTEMSFGSYNSNSIGGGCEYVGLKMVIIDEDDPKKAVQIAKERFIPLEDEIETIYIETIYPVDDTEIDIEDAGNLKLKINHRYSEY